MSGDLKSEARKYIIENSIVFIPDNGFYLYSSEEIEYKLSPIADGMFLLLITLQGRVISKQDIQNYFWQEFSIDVSSSSINNNLSDLRRYLKAMGICDLIVTTPRVGISIRPGVNIFQVDDEVMLEGREYPKNIPSQRQIGNGYKKTVAILVLFFLILGAIFFDV